MPLSYNPGYCCLSASYLQLDEVNENLEAPPEGSVLAQVVERLRKKPELTEEEMECVQLGAVYLGHIYHTGRDLTSSQMLELIKLDAQTWTAEKHATHPLKKFFVPRPAGGYKIKPGFNLHVDHLIPAAWGGIDHPRNYAIMSAALNMAFGNRFELALEKVSLLPVQHRRAVVAFARDAKRAMKSAMRAFLAELKPLTGAETITLGRQRSVEASEPAAGGAGAGAGSSSAAASGGAEADRK